MKNSDHKTVLLFDGYCNLCNSSIQFILKHEKNDQLYFASLQSETGIHLLNKFKIDSTTINSLVLIEGNKAYIKSSAALRICKYLKGLYPLLISLLIIPKRLRNLVYDYIARNRYKWYGKSDSCMMPDPSLTHRFL